MQVLSGRRCACHADWRGGSGASTKPFDWPCSRSAKIASAACFSTEHWKRSRAASGMTMTAAAHKVIVQAMDPMLCGTDADLSTTRSEPMRARRLRLTPPRHGRARCLGKVSARPHGGRHLAVKR